LTASRHKHHQLNTIEFLTVAEAAAVLRLSRDTIRRLYRNRPGVFTLSHPASAGKRAYTILRIPAAMIAADVARMSAGSSEPKGGVE
jgi:hypothetical protein